MHIKERKLLRSYQTEKYLHAMFWMLLRYVKVPDQPTDNSLIVKRIKANGLFFFSLHIVLVHNFNFFQVIQIQCKQTFYLFSSSYIIHFLNVLVLDFIIKIVSKKNNNLTVQRVLAKGGMD